ncbi:MAG: GMC family oxidoreductase [Gemmatimonadaceae bacterium]|nr:GMC family oxidoreductase [Gemmatimonadaceae bacterium]
MTRVVHESDICIIGSGITAAMVAHTLSARTNARITVVEAGEEQPTVRDRFAHRQRWLDYGESPWPRDHIDGMTADGLQSRSMCVGGLAMHWGGVTPRWAPEDFKTKSLFGVGTDWPISYEELDPWYQRAEEIIGVAGAQGPPELDPRGKPFPMPALPLSWNLERLKVWTDAAGVPMWSQPSAKNSLRYDGRAPCCRNDTCFPICPVGAKYSPDHTWDALRQQNRITLHTRTLIRRLELGGGRIERALGSRRDAKGTPVEYRAKQFVVAAGYAWSSWLLLSSAPDGLANRSGLVGKYLAGHRNVQAFVDLPIRLMPGINEQHSLVTKFFMRAPRTNNYVRHDLRVWESSVGREPRLRDGEGRLQLGDALLNEWRSRTARGTARVRAYYDVIPDKHSELTLDATQRSPFGDPLPKLAWRDDPTSATLRGPTEDYLKKLFGDLARVGNGAVIRTAVDDFQDHPAGGCRMGVDPATSVTDPHGRTHDHENLWVVGAPQCVSASCANGTLTFAALALRSADALVREVGEVRPPAARARRELQQLQERKELR